ncbi:MAG TPA: kelch repeat-containing protein [Acidimicrobiia bacterium]|nr:kelch repeat-containing protein [Acidimicrobiia bacterium]
MPVTTPRIPGVTVDPVPDSSFEFDWPTVRAASFIHRPSGAVFGIPISSLTATTCFQCSPVALRDGRVLLVGDDHIAEIWDPDTGQWTPTNRPKTEPTGLGLPPRAVALKDDRILFAFGTRVEIYDPTDGLFRLLEPVMPYVGVPVMMMDGRVLLTTNSLQGGVVFDPADESFEPVGESPRDRHGISAVALIDGRVLLDGGPYGAAVYDPTTELFTSLIKAYPTSVGVAMSPLQDGRILVTGGRVLTAIPDTDEFEDLGSVKAQIFDPTTNLYQAVGSMLEPRSHHSAVTLADGRVATVGGAHGRVEVFDPDTATFERAPSLTRPRQGPSALLLDDGNLLVIGGAGEIPFEELGMTDLTTPRTAETHHPDHRDRELATTAMSGFTLSMEVDFDGAGIEKLKGELSLLLVVPPGGLERATYAAGWWSDGGSVGGGAFGFGEFLPLRLPSDCEQGCEIRELVLQFGDSRRSDLRAPDLTLISNLGVLVHIQYEGDIPPEAEGITLTVVEKG